MSLGNRNQKPLLNTTLSFSAWMRTYEQSFTGPFGFGVSENAPPELFSERDMQGMCWQNGRQDASRWGLLFGLVRENLTLAWVAIKELKLSCHNGYIQ